MLKEVSESEDSFVDEEEKMPTGGVKGAKGKSIIEGGAGGKERDGDPSAGTISTDQREVKQETSQQNVGKPETEDKNEWDSELQNTEDQKEKEVAVKGDPEMAVVYIKTLLPMFADLFHSSQSAAVKRKILSLVHKLSHHVMQEWLQDLCQPAGEPSFLSQICELVAVTIDNEVGPRDRRGKRLPRGGRGKRLSCGGRGKRLSCGRRGRGYPVVGGAKGYPVVGGAKRLSCGGKAKGYPVVGGAYY